MHIELEWRLCGVMSPWAHETRDIRREGSPVHRCHAQCKRAHQFNRRMETKIKHLLFYKLNRAQISQS